MKLKHLLVSVFALGLVASAGAALSVHNEANAAKAEATEKQLVVKFGSQGNWNQADAKLAVYLWKGEDAEKVEAWTNTVALDSSKNLYVLDYSFDGEPEKLIVSRQSNEAGAIGDWNTSWAQSGNLAFNEATYLYVDGWNITSTSGWKVSADVRSSEVESFGTKQVLSKIGLNDAGNPEVSGKVSLVKDEEIKILSGDGVWSGYYGCPEGLEDYFEGGSKTERSDDNPNIVCKLAGTYDFYFDTETKHLWITNNALVEADGWAREFLADVKCDETSATEPTGWATSAAYYAGISGDAKDYVYGMAADEGGELVAQALARYDVAVARHSSLEKFVKDSHDNVRAAHLVYTPHAIFAADTNTMTIVVIVAALSAVSIIGVVFFVRRRKAQ